MKKSTKKKVLISAGIFAIAIALVLTFGNLLQNLGGGTVLSVSKVQFLTNSPDAQGQDAFMINIVANQGGERIRGEITPEMIAQYGIKEVPEGTFEVSLNLKDVKCNYEIQNDEAIFYKIYQASVKGGFIDAGAACPYNNIDLNSVKSNCKGTFTAGARGTTGIASSSPGSPIAGGSCDDIVSIQKTPMRPDLGQQASEWCYAMPPDVSTDGTRNSWRATHIGGIPWFVGYKIGTVATPTFTVEIEVKNSKGEKTTTTLTETETSKFLGEIGSAKFVGSLVAQEYCGVPAVEKSIVKDLQTNKLKVIRKNYYDDYQSKLFELINLDNNYYEFLYIAPTPVRVDPGVGANELWDKMSTLNSLHRMMASTEIKDNCEINGMIYSCKPSKAIIYPELQLVLKSAWIGVVIPDGKPKILNVDIPKEIISGTPSFLVVKIRNDGTGLDSFDTSLSCNKRVTLGNVRGAIDKDKTEDVFLNFIGEAGDYLCTVTTQSVNNPGNKDSKQISFKIIERELPVVANCDVIPPMPSSKSVFQGYPLCSWVDLSGEKQDYNTMWMIVGISVILGLIVIYFITRKKSGRRK